jgi:uronate dehydrogenase
MAAASSSPSAPPVFDRLLLTGAAGGLGRVLRPRLKRLCRVLRASDIAAMDPAGEGEEVVVAPLEDAAAMHALVQGVAAIVHLGGVSVEGPFQPILQANIVGLHNLYEAARKHGVRRVVFASSNHVTGFYRQDQVIGPEAPMRPDGHYGLSKAFGENLSRFYFDRYGLETVCLRIGSSFPEPKDRRMLATWLSYDDLERLVVASLTAPVVGHSVVYGFPTTRPAGGTTPRRRTSAFVRRTAPSRSAPPPRRASRSSTGAIRPRSSRAVASSPRARTRADRPRTQPMPRTIVYVALRRQPRDRGAAARSRERRAR